jgi:hypothetical protein
VVLSPVHYDLSVEVDYEAEKGQRGARIELSNPSDEPIGEASFLLYRLMRVGTVVDEKGDDLEFTQNVVAFSDFGKLQVNRLLVSVREPLPPQGRAAMVIEYEGHPLATPRRGCSTSGTGSTATSRSCATTRGHSRCPGNHPGRLCGRRSGGASTTLPGSRFRRA